MDSKVRNKSYIKSNLAYTKDPLFLCSAVRRFKFALDFVSLTAALKITRSPRGPGQKEFSLRGLGSYLAGKTLETGPELFHTVT